MFNFRIFQTIKPNVNDKSIFNHICDICFCPTIIEFNIFFCEVKWKNMTDPEVLSLIEQLKEKSVHVHWRNESRNEHYGVIARTIKGMGKEKLTDAGYFVYDLNDFEK